MVLAVMRTAGIVCLILVIVLLALGALILFLPIGYRVGCDLDRKRVSVRLNWIFGLVRLVGGFGGGVVFDLFLLWIRIPLYPRDPVRDAKKRKRKEARKKKKQKKKAKKAEKRRNKLSKEQKKEQIEVSVDIQQEKGGQTEETVQAEQTAGDSQTAEGSQKGAGKALTALKKIREICKDESTSRAVPYILEQIKYLLYHYRPRKIQADVTFGFTDPSVTGRLLGVISMLCFIFAYDIELHPVFETEDPVLSGNFQIRGHMQMIYLLIIVIRLIRVKEVRRFFKVVMRQIRKK